MKEYLTDSYDVFLKYAEKNIDETQKINVSSGSSLSGFKDMVLSVSFSF